MDEFGSGTLLGVVVMFLICVFSFMATDNDRNTMQNECEKDLARNLKCEMVYVKPSIKEGE